MNDTIYCDSTANYIDREAFTASSHSWLKKQVSYKNGVLNGYYKDTYDTGNIEIIKAEGIYVSGIRQGYWIVLPQLYGKTERRLDLFHN